MKSVFLGVGMFACLMAGVLAVQQRDATADQAMVERAPAEAAAEAQDECLTQVDSSEKKCSFNSDCKYGKCAKGVCGSCGFTSDCNGWGKCSGGQCGACGFDSECKGFGKCDKSKCTKSPY